MITTKVAVEITRPETGGKEEVANSLEAAMMLFDCQGIGTRRYKVWITVDEVVAPVVVPTS